MPAVKKKTVAKKSRRTNSKLKVASKDTCKFVLRLEPKLHKKLKAQAKKSKISMNGVLNDMVEDKFNAKTDIKSELTRLLRSL